MKKPAKIKAIIFDIDNTLVDFYNFKIQSTKAALHAMQKNGLKIKEKTFGHFFSMYYKHGFEDREIMQKFLEHKLGYVDYRLLGPAIIAYRKARDVHLKPYPGIKPTLKRLRKKGLKICIVTDAPILKAWLRLSVAGLQNDFDFVVTSTDSGGFKHDGKSFKLALKKLKLKPEQVLVLGDSGSRDITPATKFGFKTCFAMYGRVHEPLVKSDYKIKKISEILKII